MSRPSMTAIVEALAPFAGGPGTPFPKPEDFRRADDAIKTAPALDEYVRGLEQYAQAASEALLKVRPLGGSELFTRVGEQYLADPAYCGNEITSIRERLHSAKLAAALGGKP